MSPIDHEISRPDHLFHLVSKWKWSKIVEKCRNSPQETTQAELRSSDDRGYTALHWIACNRAATEGAIEAMINAYPEGLLHVSEAGWTPLHVACWRGALPHVIEFLLRREPEAAWVLDHRARLPLHSACMYAETVPVDTIRYLLLAMLRDGSRNGIEMSVLRRDQCGDTPITLLMHSYRETIKEMREGKHLQREEESGDLHEKIDHYCRKMSYLIHASDRGTLSDFSSISNALLLRQAITVNECSSPEFIELILSKVTRSELTSSEDKNENNIETLPLHLVASKPLYYDKTSMRFSRFSLNDRMKCERMVLQIILSDFPKAAILRNNHGKTALDLAIDSGKRFNQGIKELILANPSALEARCIDVRFYPVILEAMSKDIDDALDGTFLILKAQPSLVIGHCFPLNNRQRQRSKGFAANLIKSLRLVLPFCD